MPKKTPIVNDAEDSSVRDWGLLLDELRIKESINSDAKLAEALGVSRGYISLIRKGKKGLSLRLTQNVLTRLGRGFEADRLEELFVPIKLQVHSRNISKMRRFIIDRAKGLCQLCKNPAPFKDAAGRPFLKIHHLIPFQRGGADTPDNLVALCPNCYEKIHWNPTEDDEKKLEDVIASYR